MSVYICVCAPAPEPGDGDQTEAEMDMDMEMERKMGEMEQCVIGGYVRVGSLSSSGSFCGEGRTAAIRERERERERYNRAAYNDR